MSDPTKPPVILRFPDRPADDLDRLLHSFFRSEMPDPWPTWSPPQAQAVLPRSAARFRGPALRRRLVLAASVAVLLGGYLMLARAFPGSSTAPAAPSDQNTIGKVPVIPGGRLHRLPPAGNLPSTGGGDLQPKTVPVPRGGSARMWEHPLPNRGGLIQLQDIPSPHARH